MSLPKFYTQVERMIENTALQTKTARAIVRKAGLRPGESSQPTTLTKPITLIDTWIVPVASFLSQEFLWSWAIDLTGFTQIRLTSQSFGSMTIWVYYSLNETTELDAGDWVFLGSAEDSSQQDVSTPLKWMAIDEALRRPLRITVGLEQAVISQPTHPDYLVYSGGGTLAKPFSLAVQVR